MISSAEQTLLRETQPLSGSDDDYDELLDLIGERSSHYFLAHMAER